MAFSGFGSKPTTTFGSTSTFGSGGGGFGGGGGSTFGATQSTFGNTGASGSVFGGGNTGGSTFGAPASGGSIFGQTSQPSSGFGGGSTFGNAPASATSGFGSTGTSAFGQQNRSAFGASTGSAFGGASGGLGSTGGFGSTGGGGAFGQSAGGSIFGGGNTGNTGSVFGGGGGSTFGNSGSTFGGGSAFGASANTGGMMGGAGGQMPPYQPTREQEGNSVNITHAITAMPQYQATTFEELRFLDYQQGRKGGGSGAAAGGSLFGQSGANTGSVFGGGGSSAFGSKPATGGFGSTAGGGGLFGGNTAQSQSAFGSGGSAFGSSGGGSVFGGGAQSQSAFGASSTFGAKPAGSAFGSTMGQSQSAFGGTSAFGSKPAGSAFGSAPSAGGGLFGSTASSGGAFGQPSSGGSLFGGGQTAASGGMFGAAAKPAGGGLFGAQPAATGGSLFGGAASGASTGFGGGTFGAKPATSGGFGGFGGGATAQSGGGLFGAKPAGSAFGGGGLGTSAPATGGGLFGASAGAGGSSLFGGSAAAKPAGGFGASTGGLFGGGSSFGAATGQSAGSLFSASSGAASTGGLFGAAPTAQPTQPLTATLTAQPYGANPLFSNTAPATTSATASSAPALPPSQTAVGLRNRDAARKAASVASPSYKSVPKSAAHIKPRGFSRMPGGKLSLLEGEAALPVLSPDVFVARHSVKHLTIESPIIPLSKSDPADLSTDASFSAPATDRRRVTFGVNSKESPGHGASDSFSLSTAGPSTPQQNGRSDAPSSAGRSSQGHNTSGTGDATVDDLDIVRPTFIRPPAGTYRPPDGQGSGDSRRYNSYSEFYNEHVNNTSNASRGSLDKSGDLSPAGSSGGARPPTLTKEGYFTVPSISELHSMSAQQRSRIQDFVIGRSGIGQVCFLGTTDVNNLSLDDIVIFRPKEVVVYPEELHKPPEGEQLNKPSIVTLHDCLPIDKNTMRPTQDEEAIKKLANRVRRKTAKMGAEFIEFNTETGDWVFKVEHFSRYGLDDDSSSEDEENETPQRLSMKKQQMLKGKQKRQLSRGAHDDDDQQMVVADPDASTDILDENADDIANMHDVSRTRSENRFRATLDSDSSDADDLPFAPTSPIRAAPSHDVSTASGVNVSVSDAGFQGFGSSTHGRGAESSVTPGSIGLSGGPSLPQQLGLDAHSMRHMKTSLFGSGDGLDVGRPATVAGSTSRAFPDSEPSMPPTSISGIPRPSGHLSSMSSSLFKTNAMDTSGIPRPGSIAGSGASASAGTGGGIRPSLRRAVAPVVSSPAPKHSAYAASTRAASSTGSALPSVFDTAPSTPAGAAASSVPTMAQRPVEKTPLVATHAPNTVIDVPLADSVACDKSHLRTDAGLFMGRSFRPSWCTGNRVISPVSPSGTATSGFVVTITPVSAHDGSRQRESGLDESMLNTSDGTEEDHQQTAATLAGFVRSLSVHLANSRACDVDGTGCPRLSGLPTDQALYGVMEEYLDAASTQQEEAALWKLIQALWGDALDPFADDDDNGDDDDDDDDEAMGDGEQEKKKKKKKSRPAALKSDMFEGSLDNMPPKLYAQRLARRTALSRWLQESVSSDIKRVVSEPGTAPLKRIFALLTGRSIQEAVHLATQEKDHRLALLLAQAGSAGALREDIAAQRQIWEANGAKEFIQEDRERVYALLAGDMSVVADLDWRRAFAAHLWYGCESFASITDVLKVYEASYQKQQAPYPQPRYRQHGQVAPGASGPQAIDLAYHLIHLYSSRSHNLTKALLPSSVSPHPLELSRSWHVYSVLSALSYPSLSCAEDLHCSFAEQLELLGLWEWAVYVLMYLPDKTPVQQARRAQAIRSLLTRFALRLDDPAHLPQNEQESDPAHRLTIARFFAEHLQLPAQWIASARVIAARYERDTVAEMKHLLDAGDVNAAHDIFVKQLGPRGILRRDNALTTWLELLSEHASSITHWQEGGAVYADYLAIVPSRRSVPSGADGIPTLTAIQRSLSTIGQRISRWTAHDAVCRIAFSDMSTQVAVHMRQVGEMIASRRREKQGLPPAPMGPSGAVEGSSGALPYMHTMSIPASYRARELDTMASEFVSNLFAGTGGGVAV
eukprot:TRINITY_DN2302_c4_g1_i1.p1 TRINITY_DN2302_c4_g1~~TRINITY_DN2302_c4_g1_i1.p1  ORF type:complete len:2083 (+),score=587.56 TRINITY_DN2302_c4_g1_i1:397-6645(+)